MIAEHKNTETINETYAEIRNDYDNFVEELGLDENVIKQVVENENDLIDVPLEFLDISLGESGIDGIGMFAKVDIEGGKLIAAARLGDKRTQAGRYINHSPYPNVKFILNSSNDLMVVSIREIIKGDEITVDYRQAAEVNSELIEYSKLEGKSMRDVILKIEENISKMPQAYFGDSPNCPLTHTFCNGMYMREIFIPAGTYIAGEIHKNEHPVWFIEGEMIDITEDGVKHLTKNDYFVSASGTKRVGFAIQDTRWLNIFLNPTEERNVDKLKEMNLIKDYIEYDNSVLKKLNNKPCH